MAPRGDYLAKVAAEIERQPELACDTPDDRRSEETVLAVCAARGTVSRDDLAALYGISPATVTAWWLGTRRPKITKPLRERMH